MILCLNAVVWGSSGPKPIEPFELKADMSSG